MIAGTLFKNRKKRPGDESGFSLVEMLVALALTGLVLAAVYKTLGAQQKVFSVQEQSVDMQQNLRAATDLMVKDLRIAGMDPLATANAGILTATANTMRFTMDITGGTAPEFADGNTTGTDEDLTYWLDSLKLKRKLDATLVGGVRKDEDDIVARNIQAIDFFYTFRNGTQATAPVAPMTANDIRLVQVTILARNPVADKDYRNTNTYTMPSGTVLGPYNDGYRRRLITTSVRLRNMGFRQ